MILQTVMAKLHHPHLRLPKGRDLLITKQTQLRIRNRVRSAVLVEPNDTATEMLVVATAMMLVDWSIRDIDCRAQSVNSATTKM